MHRRPGLVSIIVTNHNNEKYIEACLDSLLAQSYKNIELIVVDDASSDNSRRVIRNWKQRHKGQLRHRMIFVPLPRNVGFAGAVDTGLYLAKGEYIAMQDGDDLSLPARIERQVNYLKRHPHTHIVGTNYVAFDSKGKRVTPNWLKFSTSEVRACYKAGGHCVSHGTILFRGSVFDKLGGPTRRYKGAEDYEMIANAVKAGLGVSNMKTVLYRYRMHPKQRSRKYYRS